MNDSGLIDAEAEKRVAAAGGPMQPRSPTDSRSDDGARAAGQRALSQRDVATVEDIEGPASKVRDLVRAVARRIRSRPLASLALGIGIGFVVGGALSFRAGRIALSAATRHIARELLKQVL